MKSPRKGKRPVTVYLDPLVHRRILFAATAKGIAVTGLLETVISTWVAKHAEEIDEAMVKADALKLDI